jgi:hypothetical protein
MPVMTIIQPPVGDEHVYEAIRREIDFDEKRPDGLIVHAMGEIDGLWQIINVWEAPEYAERWDRDTLQPAVQRVVGESASRRVFETFQRHDLITP